LRILLPRVQQSSQGAGTPTGGGLSRVVPPPDFFHGLLLAATLTLAWDANTDPAVVGYYLYYGQLTGSYTTKIDVGNVTQYTVSNLLDGTTYYFAATDYDAGRQESGFSNEVSATTPAPTHGHGHRHNKP
jgi:hypothetical protein